MKGHSCQGHQLHSWDISLAQLARQLLCESLLALSTRLLRAWVGCGNPPVVPRPHMRQRSRRLSEKKDGTNLPVDMKASLATHGRLNSTSSLGFWKRYKVVSPRWKKERGSGIPDTRQNSSDEELVFCLNGRIWRIQKNPKSWIVFQTSKNHIYSAVKKVDVWCGYSIILKLTWLSEVPPKSVGLSHRDRILSWPRVREAKRCKHR